MGYDLIPSNRKLEPFHFGSFSFPILLEACGYLYVCIHKGPRWYCVFGEDKRMPIGDDYPRIVSNDGFRVTAEEARIMARIARNYVIIQEKLPEENRGIEEDTSLLKSVQPWPLKIRDDFTEKFAKFSEWAPKSRGFKIY